MSTVTIALRPAEPEALRRLEDRLGHFRGHVAPERGADEVALAEPLQHGVEGLRQPADLVPRRHPERRATDLPPRRARRRPSGGRSAASGGGGPGARGRAWRGPPPRSPGGGCSGAREDGRGRSRPDRPRGGEPPDGPGRRGPARRPRSTARPGGGRRACSGPRRPPASSPWARSARARADTDRPACPGPLLARTSWAISRVGLDAREGRDRAREERLVLDRGQRLAERSVAGGVRSTGSRRPPRGGAGRAGGPTRAMFRSCVPTESSTSRCWRV